MDIFRLFEHVFVRFVFLQLKKKIYVYIHGNHAYRIINESTVQSVGFINVHPNGNARRSHDTQQIFRFARFVITSLDVREKNPTI